MTIHDRQTLCHGSCATIVYFCKGTEVDVEVFNEQPFSFLNTLANQRLYSLLSSGKVLFAVKVNLGARDDWNCINKLFEFVEALEVGDPQV